MNQVLGGRGATGYVLGRGAGASNGLLTGLVAYWKLDEASGNALDKHSGSLTLTQQNAPGADTGKVYATARTFNGTNQYFSRASEAALNGGDVDLVITAWIYASATSANHTIVEKSSGSAGNRGYSLSYVHSLSRFRFYVRNMSDTITTVVDANNYGAIALGSWIFVCAWYDSVNDSIGISINNGTANTAVCTGGILPNNAVSFQIGAGQNGALNLWNGRIGPVAMWKNRTLDSAARTALWNGGAGLAYSAFS